MIQVLLGILVENIFWEVKKRRGTTDLSSLFFQICNRRGTNVKSKT